MVRKHWACPDCVRSAQVSGTYAADLLNGPEDLHLEVKRYKSLGQLQKWMDQAVSDAKKDETPVLLMRGDGNKWIVAVQMEECRSMVSALMRVFRDQYRKDVE